MSRAAWFVAGIGAGVYGVARARRVAEAFTADGLRDRLHGLEVGARMFRDEVAAGRVESEPALRHRLGLAGAPGPSVGESPALTTTRGTLGGAGPTGSVPAADDEEGNP